MFCEEIGASQNVLARIVGTGILEPATRKLTVLEICYVHGYVYGRKTLNWTFEEAPAAET